MKEIRFRAWGVHAKQMKEVVTLVPGYYVEVPNDNELGKTEQWDEDYYLMQYTGLKDKNGKEIYEGDIVRTTDGEEEYIEDVTLHPMGVYIGANRLGEYNWDKAEPEIIGNIYENPELLKD